jgi:hypothetical protein
MDPSSLTAEIIILFLRFAIIIVLYLFLWQVVAAVWRDLRRPAEGEADPARALGRLVVVNGGPTSYQPGYAFSIHETATIGRGSDNTIVLSDGFISMNHAAISFRDGAWWLADLDARNGTWVNAEKVQGETRVRPGDVLAVGQVKLKLAR